MAAVAASAVGVNNTNTTSSSPLSLPNSHGDNSGCATGGTLLTPSNTASSLFNRTSATQLMGQAAAAAAAAAAFHLNNSNSVTNNAKITDLVLSRKVCN